MEEIKFSIVKNLPIPEKGQKGRQGRASYYPFLEMEVGDCLKFGSKDTKDANYR